jgi:cytochrome c peroxidase
MTRHIAFASLLAAIMAVACEVGEPTEEQPGLGEIADSSDDDCDKIEDQDDLEDCGEDLFEDEEFGGNGRECEDCHPSDSGQSGTLNPSQVQSKFASNPSSDLFTHDAADVIGGNTFNRIRTHATILVDMPLPANVRISGSSARNVILARGIPTTMNTPALDPVLMYDGRAPNLQAQARDAIAGHAQSTDVSSLELDAIAAFQQTLFNRSNLKYFVRYGTPLKMPFGTTDAEKRGRRFFIADDQTDPDMVGENPAAKCGWCHSGDFLDGFSAFAVANIVPFPASEGGRFAPVLVSELNSIGNTRYDFEFTNPDGSVTVVNSPDPGLALIDGIAAHSGFFKIPTVWGVKDTAPYFHDNSAKTLEQLMEHYDKALFILSTNNPRHPPVIDLTDQEKADIVAYLKRL